MVRLVFRPYTQIRRTICTSVSQRASIRVSSDFTLSRNSSPSFGSWFSYFGLKPMISASLLFIQPTKFSPEARTRIKLLGPCFKTGQLFFLVSDAIITNSPYQINFDTFQRIIASRSTVSRLLSLLSECFSTFPHGTSSLSVSPIQVVRKLLLPLFNLRSQGNLLQAFCIGFNHEPYEHFTLF